MKTIFTLLVLFQIKHFLSDFPLQGKYMLQKFKADWGFFWPLVAHCGVHAAFTLLIVLWFKPELALICAVLDFCIHFVIDRIKAGPKYLGRFKALAPTEFKFHVQTVQCGWQTPEDAGVRMSKAVLRGNTFFWWSLGLDQMVHHLTHCFIIWMIIS